MTFFFGKETAGETPAVVFILLIYIKEVARYLQPVKQKERDKDPAKRSD
jgi:hypothetical protein